MSSFHEQIAQLLEGHPTVSVSLRLAGGVSLEGALRSVSRETITVGSLEKPTIVAIAHIVSLQML